MLCIGCSYVEYLNISQSHFIYLYIFSGLMMNSCMASFVNITIIDSRTCTTFPYRRVNYSFLAISSITTIVFAFQQTVGYWDMDNIILWDHQTLENRFRNGDFESASLSPAYSQCQSTGNVNDSRPFNGRYHYSDRTQRQFGYLMQNVSITAGSWYSFSFDLQNTIGLNSSFMILLGT